MLSKIVLRFGQPKIDLFATNVKTNFPIFFSWFPDPEATKIDAFTKDWSILSSMLSLRSRLF